MQQTERYQLNQWDPEDRILRTDFNADNAKLDAALAALDTGLGKKAGVWEPITSGGHNILATYSNLFTDDIVHWNNWNYVALLANVDASKANPGTPFELRFEPNFEIVAASILPAGPFLALFTPHHNKNAKLSLIAVGSGVQFFTSDYTYAEINRIYFSYSGGTADNCLKDLSYRILGSR